MTAISGNIETFLEGKGYRGIRPVDLAPHPAQRGLTCGFSALAYAMDCLYQGRGHGLVMEKPLPARTRMEYTPRPPKTETEREIRRKDAADGRFTSLRQFGKFNALTTVGSVFSADNLLRIAKEVQPGAFDGVVVKVADPDDFCTKLVAFLDRGIPVIVPYDNEDGEPAIKEGKAAHWVPVLGYFPLSADSGGIQLVYYNYGAFAHSSLAGFAASNFQLISNTIVICRKYQVFSLKGGHWIQTESDLIGDHELGDFKKNKLVPIAGVVRTNPEYNNPAALGSSSSSSSSSLPIVNHNGLIRQFVAVYRPDQAPSSSSPKPQLTSATAASPSTSSSASTGLLPALSTSAISLI
ncbi:hypothetical protein Jab_2c16810 [Janthinobacterium sp. HH01]|uniref:hypothetical protein n=1 Tax=Janthinobacterium sp. HH01 TaxID=1198452 RepID=UPI0002AEE156|nr:hypothetical protein [Janthinobacterium sp. HH01]ELX09603.1 hypothetical protein Jab_2c16810 [Janthinobacterium sp. HH01]